MQRFWEFLRSEVREFFRCSLESAKTPCARPMAKTKSMVLVFGFSFPFPAGFQGKGGSVSAKVVLAFGFSFCLRE